MPGAEQCHSAYGAGGSLVIVFLWVYFSAQILFFGVKFTRIYSNRYGSQLEPMPRAEAVTLKEVVSE
jgi:membrane protein